MSENFAKLHEDICFGRAGGKVIWQPRIQCWYDDKMFEDGKLPGRYEGMSRLEIYKDLGCSARIYEYNDCFYPIFDETVKYRVETEGEYTRNYIETPLGTVWQEIKRTKNSWAALVTKEWVTSEEELKIYTKQNKLAHHYAETSLHN